MRCSTAGRLASVLGMLFSVACNDQVEVGAFNGQPVGGDAASDGGSPCLVTSCQNHVYACGDCVDNDGDGLADSDDPDCLTPCQNAEDTFYSAIPGSSPMRCVQDCYFDQDTGSGNDECLWTHRCDPLEVSPDFYPEGSECAYDAATTLGSLGQLKDCASLMSSQPSACDQVCRPLTPNGCDCFGCCQVPGLPNSIWLGSLRPDGSPSCNSKTTGVPSDCHPCTQVSSCVNPCERCELCVGKRSVPQDCSQDNDAASPPSQCPAGVQPCGLKGQRTCAPGYYCITGCCYETVR